MARFGSLVVASALSALMWSCSGNGDSEGEDTTSNSGGSLGADEEQKPKNTGGTGSDGADDKKLGASGGEGQGTGASSSSSGGTGTDGNGGAMSEAGQGGSSAGGGDSTTRTVDACSIARSVKETIEIGGPGPDCPEKNPWRDTSGATARICEVTEGRPAIVINAIKDCPRCKRLLSRLVTWYKDPASTPDHDLIRKINSGELAVVYVVGDMNSEQLAVLSKDDTYGHPKIHYLRGDCLFWGLHDQHGPSGTPWIVTLNPDYTWASVKPSANLLIAEPLLEHLK